MIEGCFTQASFDAYGCSRRVWSGKLEKFLIFCIARPSTATVFVKRSLCHWALPTLGMNFYILREYQRFRNDWKFQFKMIRSTTSTTSVCWLRTQVWIWSQATLSRRCLSAPWMNARRVHRVQYLDGIQHRYPSRHWSLLKQMLQKICPSLAKSAFRLLDDDCDSLTKVITAHYYWLTLLWLRWGFIRIDDRNKSLYGWSWHFKVSFKYECNDVNCDNKN